MWLKDRAQRKARRWYRRAAGDEGVAVSLDTQSDSRTLLLTFGGMKSTAGLVAFEFVALTDGIPVKKMFVRDPRQSWYHRGMPSHGNTLESVAEVLRGLLAEQEVQRLVTVGASAGGYAALVFGALLGADRVLAFAPQTTLDRRVLAEMDDRRWDYLLEPLYDKHALEERWVDLRTALPGALNGHTRCSVYFDETVEGDRLHGERLAGIDGVRLYRFGRGGHSLTRNLRDRGALERLLRQVLEVPPRTPAGAVPAEPAPAGDATPRELRYRTYK
jgi:pimeloyl-ACP methyl ester carboxylesterase